MGKRIAAIDADLGAWIAAQRVFFVATAPSGDDGHVNCSPKGGEQLRVLAPTTVAYVDRVGSGVETIAHLRQNGRIVVMLCAFEGPPRIVRLHGRGEVLPAGSAAFDTLLPQLTEAPAGARAIVRIDVARIADSCGFGVPRYRFEADREQLPAWVAKKGPDGVAAYVRDRNALSIDGLPGL
jgi:hypothetical protein